MNVNNQMMEHRWGTRAEVDLAATLKIGNREVSGRICNASLSGAFIETAESISLLLRVALRTHNSDDWLEACVVRIADNGIALEWLEPGIPVVLALMCSRGRSWSTSYFPAVRSGQAAAALDKSVQADAAVRARSGVDSREFDMQG